MSIFIRTHGELSKMRSTL